MKVRLVGLDNIEVTTVTVSKRPISKLVIYKARTFIFSVALDFSLYTFREIVPQFLEDLIVEKGDKIESQ